MIGKILLTGALVCLGMNLVFARSLTYRNHSLDLGFRPRVAHVDSAEDANAASLLVRLHLNSDWTDYLTTVIEIDHVELGWEDEFTNGVNFNDTPVIPDVGGTDLNQLLLRYSPTNNLYFVAGRERVNLGNQRFVGSNSFWQNEQTLDGLGFNIEFGVASSLSYRYIGNANRINGEDATTNLRPDDINFEANNGLRPVAFLGDHTHQTHLLFLTLKESDYSVIQAYYFDIDILDAPVLSNRTLGGRYEYKGRIQKARAFAHVEVALQDRPGVDSGKLTQYYNLGAGLGYRTQELSLNFEQLGENDGISLVTPLASLHDFNGWTDKFLVTPSSGIKDYSLKYIFRQNPWKIDTRFHFFHADNNNAQIGQELDIDVSIKFATQSILLFRFADFRTKGDSFNSEKRFFLQYIYNLSH